MLGFPVKHLVLHAAQLMERSLDTLDVTTMNAFTHTWESVLSVLETLRVGECFDVGRFCNDVEPLLQDVKSTLNGGQQFPEQAVAQLSKAAGCNEQLRVCIERDIWHSALKRRELAAMAG